MLKLIIEDDEGRKTVVPFVRDEITIGRQEGNTIRLTERNVSRRHARLVRQNGHVAVEDLGSYNGIRLNGDKISGQTPVREGDLIQIADYDLSVQSDVATQANPPATHHDHTQPATASAPRSELTTLRLDGATKPALPPVGEPSATLADEDGLEEAHPDDVTAAPTTDVPDGAPRQQSTAVIHMDAVEGARPRSVVDLDAADAPRLVVLNTEFAGREFACIRTELRLGRTDDNDIAIDHRSLSRTHCKIVREDTGEWRVLDMESANGLMVNGESYAQATLRSGDVIELGHVKVKFVGPGEAFTLTATSDGVKVKTGSRLPLVAVGLFGVIGLAGVGYWYTRNPPATSISEVPTPVKPPPPVEPVVKPDEPVVAKPPEPVKPDEPVVVAKPPVEPVKPVEPPVHVETEEEKLLAQQKLKEAMLANADVAIAAGELAKAEKLLEGCKVGNSKNPCPEAKAKLERIRSEKEFKVLLDKADRAIGEKNIDKAKDLLGQAYGTTVFLDRHKELEEKLAALIGQAMMAKKPPEPPAPKPPPVAVPVAPPAAKPSETAKLIDDAKALNKSNDYQQAKAKLLKCIQLEPGNARCHKLLGSTYALLKDNKKGVFHYKKFLELAPDDPAAANVKLIVETFEANQGK